MKKYRHHFKLAILPALISVLLTVSGCGGKESAVEALAPDTSETQTIPVTEDVQPPAENSYQRAYRTKMKGGGEDTVTLMLYLCGSDLESRSAAATFDLFEIISAEIGDNLNIVVETGGAKEWATDYMDPDLNQRWQAVSEDLILLESMEARNMSEGSTLSDFISYSAENFPADRYMLVLWDHGGGTVDGYAYDERFGDHSMMSITELDDALADAGVAFDMIGFDCCLMSTAETAFVAEKHADYMIASQRVEPGNGWHYTPWITALSRNTSIPTPELGKVIVDSFIKECKNGYSGNELTLSVTDLTYIPDLFNTLYGFLADAQGELTDGDMYVSTSHALSDSRAMQDKYDLVDMEFLLESLDGSQELINKFEQCIAYNGTTIDNHNGLCLYFPYSELDQVGDALEIYEQIGIGAPYRNFIAAYANMMLGGQVYGGGGGNPLGGDGFSLSDTLSYAWADEEAWDPLDGFFAENTYDDSEQLLPIDETDDGYVLSLSDEDWDLITDIELWVFLDDGEGYIDLGRDSTYEFDENGENLLVNFDNTWVALDGNIVCFFNTEYVYNDDGTWYNYGVVPIWFEEEHAELVIMWDDEHPDGYVAGWRYTYVGSGSQKGLFDVWDGMYFDFVCDYYTYDNEYEDLYFFGGMTVDGPIEVSYEDVGDDDCLVYYALYDIFQNVYWTEPLVFGWGNEGNVGNEW